MLSSNRIRDDYSAQPCRCNKINANKLSESSYKATVYFVESRYANVPSRDCISKSFRTRDEAMEYVRTTMEADKDAVFYTLQLCKVLGSEYIASGVRQTLQLRG